jgi:hypothetical protein
MSKETAQGLARRQRSGALGDWLLGAFVAALVIFMFAGLASTAGITAMSEPASPDVAATPAQVVERHTELYCGDVPPPLPMKGERPTC